MTKHDEVNHPQHYTSHPSGIECIEVTRHMTFNLGNAIKYCWRAGLKNNPTKSEIDAHITDLEKAVWYIKDEIKLLKGDYHVEDHQLQLNLEENSSRTSTGSVVQLGTDTIRREYDLCGSCGRSQQYCDGRCRSA